MMTAVVVLFCYYCRKQYRSHLTLKRKLDEGLKIALQKRNDSYIPCDPDDPTAVFLLQSVGEAMHMILWVERMFPKRFKNYIFMTYGQVDMGCFGSDRALYLMQANRKRVLSYLQDFAAFFKI